MKCAVNSVSDSTHKSPLMSNYSDALVITPSAFILCFNLNQHPRAPFSINMNIVCFFSRFQNEYLSILHPVIYKYA